MDRGWQLIAQDLFAHWSVIGQQLHCASLVLYLIIIIIIISLPFSVLSNSYISTFISDPFPIPLGDCEWVAVWCLAAWQLNHNSIAWSTLNYVSIILYGMRKKSKKKHNLSFDSYCFWTHFCEFYSQIYAESCVWLFFAGVEWKPFLILV